MSITSRSRHLRALWVLALVASVLVVYPAAPAAAPAPSPAEVDPLVAEVVGIVEQTRPRPEPATSTSADFRRAVEEAIASDDADALRRVLDPARHEGKADVRVDETRTDDQRLGNAIEQDAQPDG